MSGLEYLVGEPSTRRAKPLRPFDDAALSFLADLSRALMRAPDAKGYPDVTSFAYFIRRANLERLKEPYADELHERVGRGLAFHIAPGNVPVNFAYSLISALLAGNASVVRASQKPFAQVDIICREMGALIRGDHAAMLPYVSVVRYPREDVEKTRELSAACDARIIWGGDETVRRVREAPLPMRAADIAFPDRYSLLAISAQAVCRLDDSALAKAALGFYNDTYLTDQNACTSPRLVYWLGSGAELDAAKARFWRAVREYAAPRYELQPVLAVDKLCEACRMGIELAGARVIAEPDSLVTRVSVSELLPGLDGYRSAGGFFVEYASDTLDALIPLVTPKYQTLSYLGLEPATLQKFVTQHGLRGIDRIAPIGRTMDFALVWDGIDLIRALSRRVTAF